MRWVQAAVVRPHKCSVIPFIGGHHPKGFFDFGTSMPVMDGHVYVSVVAAEQMAAAMGWAPSGDTANLRAQLRARDAELAQAREETVALQEQLDAVQVLKNSGFTQARPPGRPRKVAA